MNRSAFRRDLRMACVVARGRSLNRGSPRRRWHRGPRSLEWAGRRRRRQQDRGRGGALLENRSGMASPVRGRSSDLPGRRTAPAVPPSSTDQITDVTAATLEDPLCPKLFGGTANAPSPAPTRDGPPAYRRCQAPPDRRPRGDLDGAAIGHRADGSLDFHADQVMRGAAPGRMVVRTPPNGWA